MRKTTALLLLLITNCPAAFGSDSNTDDRQPQVILPAAGNLSYHDSTNEPGYVYFQGHAVASGLIAAYWEAHYPEAEPTNLRDATPVREMYLRFYPDTPSQSQLPSFLSPSGTPIQPQRVFLYRSRGPEDQPGMLISAYTENDLADIRALAQHFSDVPDSFLNQREGVIVQPAEITMDNLVSFIEADHRFLYGKIQAFEPVPMADYLLAQIPDSNTDAFLGTPWVEMLYAPHSLTIHESPDKNAGIVAKLSSGTTSIRKIQTIDDDWVLIESTNDTQNTITGYARKHALFPIN